MHQGVRHIAGGLPRTCGVSQPYLKRLLIISFAWPLFARPGRLARRGKLGRAADLLLRRSNTIHIHA
eukprot:780261-Pyramimonas_sp.AAC.1